VCSKFCTQLTDVVDNYQILYKEIINCSKDLSEKAADFSSTFYQMQRMMSQMCELQKRVQCPSQAQAFEHLSRVMSSTGIYVKNLGELMKKYFADHLKFNLNEGDSFREMFSNRDLLFQQYQRLDKALAEKKERLFKMRDPTKWGGFKDQAEMIRLKDELMKDRDSAFEYMMPRESQELDLKR
jgi:phage-related minor tail protein